MYSVIRSFDAIEFLKKEYNDTITTTYYSYIVSRAISQGQHEVVLKFLEKVQSSQKN